MLEQYRQLPLFVVKTRRAIALLLCRYIKPDLYPVNVFATWFSHHHSHLHIPVRAFLGKPFQVGGIGISVFRPVNITLPSGERAGYKIQAQCLIILSRQVSAVKIGFLLLFQDAFTRSVSFKAFSALAGRMAGRILSILTG